MKIEGFIWYRDVIDKLLQKHQVTDDEVEEIFANKPKFTFIEKGRVKTEKNYFGIEKELSDAINKMVKLKGVLPETLVNLWLKEKVMEAR